MHVHVACNFINGIVTAYIFHIHQRLFSFTQDTAVNRTRLLINTWGGVDVPSKLVQPTGLDVGVLSQFNGIKLLHDVTKHSTLSATRRAHFFLHLIFVISFALSAHYGHF